MDVRLHHLILTAVITVCIITGPLVAILIRHHRQALAFDLPGLEKAPPEAQLNLLVCVYTPRHMPAALNFVEMSRGADRAPLSAHLMHLIKLTELTAAADLLFQYPSEGEDDHQDHEDQHGGQDVHLVHAAADAFIHETGASLHFLKAVSDFRTMHEDVCNAADDVGANIVLLPFHKHRLCDGLMEVTDEGYRVASQKVLERARCTVAMLVDRGIGGGGHQQVAALFFGGPDDREALSYAARIAGHPAVTMTVVRFLPASEKVFQSEVSTWPAKSKGVEGGVLDAFSQLEVESSVDWDFISTYYNRYAVLEFTKY